MEKVSLKKLFLETFMLSAFTFGGGYVIITLMQKKFVDKYHWIDHEEMLDLVAIAQSAPGAIAINGSIAVGYKLRGYIGIITCVLGTVLPPFLIITLVASFYEIFKSNIYLATILEGMQAGVGAVIFCVVYEMIFGVIKSKNKFSILIMIVVFILNYYFNISVVYLLLACIGIGILKVMIKKEVK